jgi:uncharacterized protein YbjT (DUF2867 family)
MKKKLIITGCTGMVGEGVLHECLWHDAIGEILVVGRKPCGIVHPKIKEIILPDFFDLSAIENRLSGYDACFFCLGVSSVGMSEADFHHFTFDLTMNFAGTLSKQNPEMVFCYISGAGTDSSEKGRQMWARVKGKTENALRELPFKNVYLFRPGYMQPTQGLKNTLTYYRYIKWMYPFLRKVFPGFVSTLKELALAMINAAVAGYPKQVLEVKDIVMLSKL